jgi:hypothetical protein
MSRATVYQHPSARVTMDDPREPPHPEDEGSYPGLPVPGHSEPIHLLALRGDLPAQSCAACGEATAYHYDTSGILFIGCHGVMARKRLHAMKTQPMTDLTVWGDQHPVVSATVRDALRSACGPAMSVFFDTLPSEDRVAISRRLADLAVIAYLSEMAR